MSKRAEKFRQMGPEELRAQEHELEDQLFRLKFQAAMGQTESVKKMRELRKNIARVKTELNVRQRRAAVSSAPAGQR
jgi:large subunit ribosomal protein L29